MNCSYHPEVVASGSCSTCGRNLCQNCAHQIKEKAYCQDCLVQGAEWAARMRDPDASPEYPRRAAWVSVIPALGAIYNGQYLKAVTHFAVFAALCIMSDDVHGVFGWAAATFYFYMFFDAYRSAQQLQLKRLSVDVTSEQWTPTDAKSPFWGFLLIGLGFVFTLHNMGIIDFDVVRRFWPLIFIVVGGLLVYRSFKGRGGDASTGSSFKGFGA